MSMKILRKLSNVEDKLYINFVQDIAYCLIRPTANKFLTKSREPELGFSKVLVNFTLPFVQ